MIKKQSTKKLINFAIASAMATGAVVAVAPAQADAASPFKDVKTTNPHYNDIVKLTESGAIKGFGDGTFKPNNSVTRGQAAKIIAGVLGLDTKNVTNPGFKDVSSKSVYYGAIAALAKAGYINGFADGTYRADETLTRGQMAKIIATSFALTSNGATVPFKDITNSQYKEQIAALFTNGVTTGKTATTFDAKSPVTRGQLASFVVRAETAKANSTVSSTITSVKDGQVVTANGTFEIDPAVAKVFSDANAAALKDANVELVVEYTNEPVAAVGKFFAAKQGRVVGLRHLTLNAPNASFNAGGAVINSLVVNALNVAISEVRAETLEVKKDGVTITGSTISQAITVVQNIIVALKEVVAPKVNVGTGSKLTVDTKSVISALNLPANTTLKDIITNYAEIQNTITQIIKEVLTGGTTTPVTPPPAGGGGATPSLEATVDAVINALVNKYDQDVPDYATITFNSSKNEIALNVVTGTTALSTVRIDMRNYNATAPSLKDIINDDDVTLTSLVNVYDKLTSIKSGGETYTKAEFIGSDLVPDKNLIVTTIDNLVDANSSNATTLDGIKGKSTTITVNLTGYSSIEYTLKVLPVPAQ